MSKKPVQNITHTIKLIVGAGKATPTPPVGPALGQKGVKAIDFCKQFNDRTKDFVPGIPISTKLVVKPDRTFEFEIKRPQTSWLLKQALGVEKGSARPHDVKVGTLSLKHIYHIAQVKKDDPAFVGKDLRSVCSRVYAQAKAMGIEIVP
ncbi:50S ribosomal protein L11 [Gorgonomyces haynaldii]|nr:50S ribosomal protein L11 [Gorgonomyces haynaldii]